MYNDIINIINSVGFPIFAFCVSGYALKYSYDKSLEQHDKSFEEISKLTKAVNNNTTILTRLVEKMEVSKDE